MAPLAFIPEHEWSADGLVFEGGTEHVIEDAPASLVKLAGSAHAAGAIVVTHGLDTAHVQSQEDGEAAYAAAQAIPLGEEGSWHDGNLAQFEIDQAAKAAGTFGVDGGE